MPIDEHREVNYRNGEDRPPSKPKLRSSSTTALTIAMLRELQYCDWLALPNAMDVVAEDGGAVLRVRPERLPLTYTLQARLGA